MIAGSCADAADVADGAGTGASAPFRLLGAWEATGRRDLASHLAHFGPLPPHSSEAGRLFVRAVSDAGLLGRGGAGFPSAVKLGSRRPIRDESRRIGRLAVRAAGFARAARGVLVVNAMEGEPASLKDAVLLTCAPHLVLEGAQLAADAVGARLVVVCVPDDRDTALASVLEAVDERHRAHALAVPTRVARPPGRYVAGEESALVGWLAGRPAVPAFRMDKSAPLELDGAPVLVHNAETLAQMALIARCGPSPWDVPSRRADPRRPGARELPQTTLVTVSGAVARPGVYEVALGRVTLDTMAALAGPTAPPAAVLVGGYGGTWVAADRLATPYDKNGLSRVGASLGAGIVVVLPEGACGLAETARLAAFMAGEGAGQCGPCVFGLPALADDLALLTSGRGDPAVVRRISRRTASVTGRGACRHPDGVARMVTSALAVFADDVGAHAAGRPCGAARWPSVLPGPGAER